MSCCAKVIQFISYCTHVEYTYMKTDSSHMLFIIHYIVISISTYTQDSLHSRQTCQGVETFVQTDKTPLFEQTRWTLS